MASNVLLADVYIDIRSMELRLSKQEERKGTSLAAGATIKLEWWSIHQSSHKGMC